MLDPDPIVGRPPDCPQPTRKVHRMFDFIATFFKDLLLHILAAPGFFFSR